MPEPGRTHAAASNVLAGLLILVGIALIVRTLTAGGGALATGLVLGVLFVAAGGGRIYLRRAAR